MIRCLFFTNVMLFIVRMVCGSCSAEQPFTTKSTCCKCGFSLIHAPSGKGFWEGGEGERDVTRMSRNDSRKYKGIAKTQSKKLKGGSPTEEPKGK